MISVLLLTYNEAENIGACLDELSWCDDIWVVDSRSTDDTVEIARARGANILHRDWTNFADQRNWGVENAAFKHDWVLHLDADEVVSPELRAELLDVARAAPSDIGAYELPLRILFMGRWLRHGGSYPQAQVRFGHRDRLRFRIVGHGQKEQLLEGRLDALAGDLLHFSFGKGIASWVDKHKTYAVHDVRAETSGEAAALDGSLTAATRRRRWLRRLSRNAPARPLMRFLYSYVARGGFLDGRAGFYYACLYAFYEALMVLTKHEQEFGRDSLAGWAAGGSRGEPT